MQSYSFGRVFDNSFHSHSLATLLPAINKLRPPVDKRQLRLRAIHLPLYMKQLCTSAICHNCHCALIDRQTSSRCISHCCENGSAWMTASITFIWVN
ncbi:Gluconokinase [Trichinella pseudospiralis]